MAGKGRFWNFLKLRNERQEDNSAREIEWRYESVFNSLALGILNMKRNGGFIEANPFFCNFIGYSRDELLKMNILDITHPDDYEKTRLGFQAPTDRRVEIEKRYIRKDKAVVWGRVSSSWVKSPYGEVSVGIIQDITERKRVELEKEHSLSLLHATLESTADGILVIGLNREIVSYNQKFVQLWNVPDSLISSLNGESVLSFVLRQVKDSELALSKIRYMQAHPDNESLDFLDLKDGRTFERHSLPQWLNGKCIGRVLSFRDITEKRKMEEERLRHEKLESLGLLAGGIAHDFNNILTGILGNISLAKVDADPQILDEAEKASLRAKGLANQLLTFAKGGAPKKTINIIGNLVKDSAEFVLRGSNVQAHFAIPSDLSPVEVDEGQISQVIQNLVINARHAMPEGGIVEISAENCRMAPEDNKESFIKEGNYVKIQIKDSGAGIPKDILGKIFDPYFTTKPKGTGLGLSLSYSIIKQHGGYLTVQSELGQGASFNILLPSYAEGIGMAREKGSYLAKGKGRVLVMDDDESVRQTSGKMLTFLGYQVVLASEGSEAVELYRRAKDTGHPFDIAILDLTVNGGMGGKEAMQKIREIDPDAKGVVSSGYSDNLDLTDYQKHGFINVIPKPYRIQEFSRILADAFVKNI